ncbi:type IV toxin-antitoxin system AbiEi family antitoxin [Roseateles sp. SL47]|uniref:type IV toxin-antitoxin system AbiEi family antitoxin n=1 Tax=Roseateles sp. SL47 TaxID=2995138 RepID=UPI00226FEED1|nr:type IV toxin-antitoxin system AbiEi family antitoxin [Roseateles sp. SL47]WAC73990.1 type IV toxin-antitoxin system AbiEi family antitoxin [Roseateles sp. SL47]
MLNTRKLLNFEAEAESLLRGVLAKAPGLKVQALRTSLDLPDTGIDIVCSISVLERQHELVCEVKTTGQPRHVREAIFQLKRYVAQRDGIPIFIAPYLSEDARALCIESGVGYLDGYGNAHIAFPGFFVSCTMAGKPTAERRDLKSLFKPKSASVLRTLLREPTTPWRVADLAKAAMVSVGHVSNVRNSLVERGWAEIADGGVFLSKPNSLLDTWRDEYSPPAGERRSFYTTQHGSRLIETLRDQWDGLLQHGIVTFASFSAANWIAPFARTGTHIFYADEEGLEHLCEILGLAPTARGENVAVTVVDDLALLRDSIEPAPGIHCTSPVQTYLDLYVSGERGREAAEHLRRETLQWS